MTGPLRIVRYHPRAAVGDGGMTWAIRRWSLALAAAGAEVTIAYADGAPPADSGPVSWVRVEHRGPSAVRIPVGLERVIGGTDVLVLHSAWTAHNARAAAVARGLGVPYLLEPRGAYDPHILRRRRRAKRAWWWALERRVVAGAAGVHVFFAEELAHLDALGYRGPTVVAPNGVDAPETPSATRNGGYLLWMGRFDPEHKGLDLLVRAVAELPAELRPSVRLNGPDWRGGKQVVENLVEQLGLRPWVAIGPAVYGPDKERLLCSATGFLYPSRWEAFGNAPLEAVVRGVPTLCTTYPLGIHLAQQGGAFLAEATPGAIAQVLPAFADPTRAALVGATGAAVARADFRWEAVATQWLEQVGACLAERGRR